MNSRYKAATVAFLLYTASELAFYLWNMPLELNYQYFILQGFISLIGTAFGSKLFRSAFLMQSLWFFIVAYDSFLYLFHDVTTLINPSHEYTMVGLNLLILVIIIGGDDGINSVKRTWRGYRRSWLAGVQIKTD
jgi:hypothetical protein